MINRNPFWSSCVLLSVLAVEVLPMATSAIAQVGRRVPFQFTAAAGCSDDLVCDFTFPRVPDGRRREITNVACHFPTEPTAEWQIFTLRIEGTGFATYLLPVEIGVANDKTFQSNDQTLVYLSEGERPVIRAALEGEAGGTFSGNCFCTISGETIVTE